MTIEPFWDRGQRAEFRQGDFSPAVLFQLSALDFGTRVDRKKVSRHRIRPDRIDAEL